MHPKTINFGLYLHYHLDHRADHMLMIREFDIPSHADALMPHTLMFKKFFLIPLVRTLCGSGNLTGVISDVQGVCGKESGSAVVCGPTQVKNKKVKMMFKARFFVMFYIFLCCRQAEFIFIIKARFFICFFVEGRRVKDISSLFYFQTNSSGQSYKDTKTRLKEMILDEHVEVSFKNYDNEDLCG